MRPVDSQVPEGAFQTLALKAEARLIISSWSGSSLLLDGHRPKFFWSKLFLPFVKGGSSLFSQFGSYFSRLLSTQVCFFELDHGIVGTSHHAFSDTVLNPSNGLLRFLAQLGFR